jgi:quinol monooxygenase YgiN
MNIYLEGKRILTTQSGCQVIDRKTVNRIRQTPTSVTYEIFEKPTFEERLNVYCEWENKYYDDEGHWTVVYDGEDILELYKNYNNTDYICEYEGEDEFYKELRTRTDYVEEIEYPGSEKFEELNKDECVPVIAYVLLKPRPVREVLNLIIEEMRNEEYELEWGII